MNLRELTEAFVASLPKLSIDEMDIKERAVRDVLAKPRDVGPGYRRAARQALRAIAAKRLRRMFL